MVKVFQNKKIYLILVASFLIFVLVFWWFKTEKVSTICGNNKCEAKENCWNCGIDCKCGDKEYCSFNDKKCLKPICGNGVCEPFEGAQNCCLDCKCLSQVFTCDKETKKCELKEMKISDKRTIELVNQHYKNLGVKVKESKILGVGLAFDELIKKVKVQTSDGKIEYLGITEKEKIITLPVF